LSVPFCDAFSKANALDGPRQSFYAVGVRALAVMVATVGGVGYAPVASGTVGSLVALPLLPPLAALRGYAPWAYAVLLVALAGIEGGLGVVGDDLVAGLYAGLVTRVLLAVV